MSVDMLVHVMCLIKQILEISLKLKTVYRQLKIKVRKCIFFKRFGTILLITYASKIYTPNHDININLFFRQTDKHYGPYIITEETDHK